MQTLRDVLGYSSNPKNQVVGDLVDAEFDQNCVVMIGVMGAGKTAHQAGLIKAADRKVSKSRNTEYPFRYLLDEGGTDIIHDVAALRAGHFPPKTMSLKSTTIKPSATFEWSHVKFLAGQTIPVWKKQTKMVLLDLAGEDIVLLIDKVKAARTLQQAAALNADRITNTINKATALLIIIKATRAQGLGIELEAEPTGFDGMSIYSDANLARILNKIIKYKKQNPNGPQLRKIAIVVTAWDGLDPVAKQIAQITGEPFDPTDTNLSAESLDKFVYACFPSTHAEIVSLGLKDVRYFPSFFRTEKDDAGNPICWPNPDGSPGKSPKIKRKNIFDTDENQKWEDNVNTICDSEFWFFKELDWLQELAVTR